MPRPRRESTVPARIRRSSYERARAISGRYGLPSIADAIELVLVGWDLLDARQRGLALGEEEELEGDFEWPDSEEE